MILCLKSRNKSRRMIFLYSNILPYIHYRNNSKGDKRKKQHSIQAIVLGAVMVIIGLIPFIGGIINILIWLYSLYIGYKASVNEDIAIPYITDFARKYV